MLNKISAVLRSPTKHAPAPDRFVVFRDVIARLREAGIRPVLVGKWAAAAHGYVASAPMFELVVDANVASDVLAVLRGVGVPPSKLHEDDLLDGRALIIGEEPWCIWFGTSWGGQRHASLLAESTLVKSGSADVDVLSLASLVRLQAHASDSLAAWDAQHLLEIESGAYPLDDGERGDDAWRALAGHNACGWYAENKSMAIDFSVVQEA